MILAVLPVMLWCQYQQQFYDGDTGSDVLMQRIMPVSEVMSWFSQWCYDGSNNGNVSSDIVLGAMMSLSAIVLWYQCWQWHQDAKDMMLCQQCCDADDSKANNDTLILTKLWWLWQWQKWWCWWWQHQCLWCHDTKNKKHDANNDGANVRRP